MPTTRIYLVDSRPDIESLHNTLQALQVNVNDFSVALLQKGDLEDVKSLDLTSDFTLFVFDSSIGNPCEFKDVDIEIKKFVDKCAKGHGENLHFICLRRFSCKQCRPATYPTSISNKIGYGDETPFKNDVFVKLWVKGNKSIFHLKSGGDYTKYMAVLLLNAIELLYDPEKNCRRNPRLENTLNGSRSDRERLKRLIQDFGENLRKRAEADQYNSMDTAVAYLIDISIHQAAALLPYRISKEYLSKRR